MTFEQREPKFSATLFTSEVEDRGGPRWPNQTGYFEMTVADLQVFLEFCQTVEPELNYFNEPAIRLEIACWNNTAASGKKYDSCSIAPKKQTRFKPEEMPGETPHITTERAQVIDEDEVI